MSNLEILNNKELRAKCMEYGLPNVPVTNSSRKLLIRRLEAAMSDKSPAAAQSKRRETTNVSKQPQITSSPKITINKNNETTSKVSITVSNKASQASTKRQLDTTVNDSDTTGISPKRVDNAKDKAVDKSMLYPKLPAKEQSPKPRVLSRTSIVTTTSVQESNKNRNKNNAESYDIDSDAQQSARKYTTSNLTTLPFNSGTQYSSLGSSSLSYSYSSTPSTYTTTSSSSRKTYAAPSSYRYDGDSKVTSQIYEVEEASDDDVVLVENGNERKGIQTPFLSNFARNLESLKKSTSQREGESIYSRSNLGVTGGAIIAARRSLKDAQGLDRW